MLPQHQAHELLAQVMCSGNYQRFFLLFYPVTRIAYQDSSSSSQSRETHALFLLYFVYMGHAFPSVCLLLIYLRMYSFMPLSSSRKVLELS
jgi:hypothetical protein